MIDPRQLYPDIPAGNTNHRKNTVSGMLTADAKGAHIIVRTGNTYFIYAHLDPSSIQVGTHVEAGQVIGRIEGNHLHFEARTHGANLVEIDRHTGDYIPEDPNEPLKLDKPLLAADPKLYFNSEMASAIDHGIAERNKYVVARGIGEEAYDPEDADVRMIESMATRCIQKN